MIESMIRGSKRDGSLRSGQPRQSARAVLKAAERSKARLTDAELEDAMQRRRHARASLAIEGIHLTAEQEALFDAFERGRLTHEERRRILIDYARTVAAEEPAD